MNWSVRPGPPAAEPDRHGRSGGVTCLGPIDLETVGFEDFRQTIADRPRLARRARHFDQPPGGVDQPLAVDVRFQSLEGCWIGLHEES